MTRFFARLSKNRPLLFFVLSALLALVACVLRTIALFVSFDADIGYFHSASVLVILARVCLILCAASCVAIPFFINKEAFPDEPAPLKAHRFACAALCAALLCVTAFFLIVRVKKIPAPQLLVLLAGLALLGAAVYFLLRLLHATSHTAVSLGFLVILAAALVLAISYFDRYTQMNAPHKLSLHLCLLAIMFAMLYELRALLGRSAPRACLIATVFAASLCTVCSLSNLIAFLGGVYTDTMYLFFDLLVLGFAAYFIAKSISLAVALCCQKAEVTQ